jgi:hypothetical protein
VRRGEGNDASRGRPGASSGKVDPLLGGLQGRPPRTIEEALAESGRRTSLDLLVQTGTPPAMRSTNINTDPHRTIDGSSIKLG